MCTYWGLTPLYRDVTLWHSHEQARSGMKPTCLDGSSVRFFIIMYVTSDDYIIFVIIPFVEFFGTNEGSEIAVNKISNP